MMEVTNNTTGILFYDGKSYAPGAVVKLSDTDAQLPDIAAMLESGDLGVKLSARASEGLSVEQIKAALTAKGVAIPEGVKKADLAALLDAA